MRTLLRRYRDDQRGVTAVEASLLSAAFVLLLGAAIEMGMAYHRYNAAVQSARIGARLAATNPPVSSTLANMTGLGGGVQAGDPLPPYSITCSGSTRRCSQGGYNASAMDVLIHGPDGVSCTARGNRAAQGMCDYVDLDGSNVEVRYESSGLGTAGRPADPVPLITVTVTGLEREFVLLERIFPDGLSMRPISVTVMAEDLGDS